MQNFQIDHINIGYNLVQRLYAPALLFVLAIAVYLMWSIWKFCIQSGAGPKSAHPKTLSVSDLVTGKLKWTQAMSDEK